MNNASNAIPYGEGLRRDFAAKSSDFAGEVTTNDF